MITFKWETTDNWTKTKDIFENKCNECCMKCEMQGKCDKNCVQNHMQVHCDVCKYN